MPPATPSASTEIAPATAQASDPSAEADAIGGDIIVTAQRRAQSLRDVPIAITVVNGQSIRETGANQLADITQRAPSLNVTATPGVPNFAIRGVGTISFDYSHHGPR